MANKTIYVKEFQFLIGRLDTNIRIKEGFYVHSFNSS